MVKYILKEKKHDIDYCKLKTYDPYISLFTTWYVINILVCLLNFYIA